MRRFSYFLLIILLTSCYEDVDLTPEPTKIVEVSVTRMQTGISGSVSAIDGSLISDFSLLINNEEYPISGDFFYLEIENLKKKGQLITIMKDDQVVGYGFPLLTENDVHALKLQMYEGSEEIVNSTEPLTISSSLSITSTQEVKVTLGYYNNSRSIAPIGYSLDGKMKHLTDVKSFHIASDDAVTLNATGVESGKTLFAYNKAKGYFQEVIFEDFTIVSGYYILAHSEDGFYAEGQTEFSGVTVSYLDFSVDNDQDGLTSSKGKWAAILPADTDSEVNFISPCGDGVGETQIEKSETNSEVNVNSNIDSASELLFQVSTQLIDCTGDVNSNPAFQIPAGADESRVYIYDEASINTAIVMCDEAFSIGGYNIESQELMTPLSWNTQADYGLEYLTDCESFSDGFSYISIDDKIEVFDDFTIDKLQDVTDIKLFDESIIIRFKGFNEGIYNADEVNILIDTDDFDGNGYFISCLNSPVGCGIDKFEVTHYDEVVDGQFRVAFSGTLWILEKGTPAKAKDVTIKGVILVKL